GSTSTTARLWGDGDPVSVPNGSAVIQETQFGGLGLSESGEIVSGSQFFGTWKDKNGDEHVDRPGGAMFACASPGQPIRVVFMGEDVPVESGFVPAIDSSQFPVLKLTSSGMILSDWRGVI